MSEIDQIIKRHFGSSGEAQRALGISRQLLHYWRKVGIPHLRRYQIQSVIDARKKKSSRRSRLPNLQG